MGGRIELESELNVGTTFTVFLPFEIDRAYEWKENEERELSDDCLKGIKVLLTEDNELNMEIAEFLLGNAGMEVTKAYNGKEAVDQFAASEEGYFDFILMDVMMPVMDGLTATQMIRSMPREDAKKIPVFAMTANAFLEDKMQSRKAGMNEHLSKPLDVDKMMRTFKKYLMSNTEC